MNNTINQINNSNTPYNTKNKISAKDKLKTIGYTNNKIDADEFMHDFKIKSSEQNLFARYLQDVFKVISNTNIKKNNKEKGINYLGFSEYYKNIPQMLSKRLFKAFDLDGNEILDFKEFITGMLLLFCSNFKSMAKIIFQLYDFDNDGYITKEDVKILFSYIPVISNKNLKQDNFIKLEKLSINPYNILSDKKNSISITKSKISPSRVKFSNNKKILDDNYISNSENYNIKYSTENLNLIKSKVTDTFVKNESSTDSINLKDNINSNKMINKCINENNKNVSLDTQNVTNDNAQYFKKKIKSDDILTNKLSNDIISDNFKQNKSIQYLIQLESKLELNTMLEILFNKSAYLNFDDFIEMVETKISEVVLYILIFLLNSKPFSNNTLREYKHFNHLDHVSFYTPQIKSRYFINSPSINSRFTVSKDISKSPLLNNKKFKLNKNNSNNDNVLNKYLVNSTTPVLNSKVAFKNNNSNNFNKKVFNSRNDLKNIELDFVHRYKEKDKDLNKASEKVLICKNNKNITSNLYETVNIQCKSKLNNIIENDSEESGSSDISLKKIEKLNYIDKISSLSNLKINNNNLRLKNEAIKSSYNLDKKNHFAISNILHNVERSRRYFMGCGLSMTSLNISKKIKSNVKVQDNKTKKNSIASSVNQLHSKQDSLKINDLDSINNNINFDPLNNIKNENINANNNSINNTEENNQYYSALISEDNNSNISVDDICSNFNPIDKNKESTQFEGYMYKILKKKELKKYYFKLICKDLFIYKNKGDLNHEGILVLSNAFFREEKTVILYDNEYFCFSLNIANKAKVYLVDNICEFKSWCFALKAVTDFKSYIDQYTESDIVIKRGKFGIVKIGKCNQTNEDIAIKIINKEELSMDYLKYVKNEIEALKICYHPNIIRLREVCENQKFIYLIMDYFSGGCLMNYLEKYIKVINEEKIKKLTYKILSAVDYLHNYGIIHRDLKPNNILMTDQSYDSDIRIIDFGLSTIIGPKETCRQSVGSLAYVAPEVLQEKCYDFSADIWSVGIIVYLLITQKLPFDSVVSSGEIIRKTIEEEEIYDEYIWKNYSAESKDFVKSN